MTPDWLHILSLFFLALGAPCLLGIAFDVLHHPQHMAVMNVVWPVTALFSTAWVAWQYARYGRLSR